MPITKPKGYPKTGGRQKGTKNKATLKAEELREIFNNRMMERWYALLEEQLKDAKKNFKARHYIFDQVIGKPKETVEIGGNQENPLEIKLIGLSKTMKKVYGNDRPS